MRKLFLTMMIFILYFIQTLYAGNLSQEESNFLLTSCPELNYMVETGYVIAYGQIIKAPFLITQNREMIYIDGIKVSPREEKRAGYLAEKKAYEAHEYYYELKKAGNSSALSLLKEKLREMQVNGEIDDYSFEQKKFLSLTISVSQNRGRAYLDFLPRNISNRYDFILAVVSSKYLLMKDDIGQEKAFEWLKQQFAKLKEIGVLEEYKFIEGLEAADITYAGGTGGTVWGISDGPLPPRAVEYMKFWKANQGVIKNKIENIKSNLRNNRIYIYSYEFEKETDFNHETLELMKAVKEKKKKTMDSKNLKNQLKLSSQEENALLEELK